MLLVLGLLGIAIASLAFVPLDGPARAGGADDDHDPARDGEDKDRLVPQDDGPDLGPDLGPDPGPDLDSGPDGTIWDGDGPRPDRGVNPSTGPDDDAEADVEAGDLAPAQRDPGEGGDRLEGPDKPGNRFGTGFSGEIRYGGDAADSLTGSDADDYLSGGDGDDRLSGGAGTDELHGGRGDDLLEGGAGDDLVYGHVGDDTLFGGAGHDRLIGGSGADMLFGGAGDDVLMGHHDDDNLTGGAGADTLFGGDGDDILDGITGEDVPTADFLNGGAGDDRLIGGGHDMMHGGSGADSFVIDLLQARMAPATITDFTPAEDLIVLRYPEGTAPPLLRADAAVNGIMLVADGAPVALLAGQTAFDPGSVLLLEH